MTRYWKHAAATLFAAAMVATGVAVASPADAVVDDCTNLYVCAYQDQNFGNPKILMKIGCHNLGACGLGAWNDRITSIRNDSDKTMCFWTDAEYHGTEYVMPPRSFIGNVGVAFNDKFSSLRETGL